MNERTLHKTLVFSDSDNGGLIHVANIKGGVGKSTVATNLSAALAKRGKTLVIDLDVQGSATHALGLDPSKAAISSWDLFACRFVNQRAGNTSGGSFLSRLTDTIRNVESRFLPQIVGRDEIISCVSHIGPCLDLIPASSDLFKPARFYHYHNLIHNLHLCRQHYKYIIIDTPSVWNRLTRLLYLQSDLNLIPVTLNALSTRSLRDYLKSVKQLAHRHNSVRIRIVKNEVFGREGSKIKGKTRTMNENRLFLDSLCEQVVIDNATGISLLPQSIIFDLEIPESATVRNAQDEGKAVQDYRQYSSIAKAFDELSKRIQYVLNSPIIQVAKHHFWFTQERLDVAANIISLVLVVFLFFDNTPVAGFSVPRPIAPQQLIVKSEEVITHTFQEGESLQKLAKYALCRFCAIVPSNKQIRDYIEECIVIHNRTRMPGERKITNNLFVSAGTTLCFYPPEKIDNIKTKKLAPVYNYFTALVDDPFAYVTGDWCERGTGGGTPHYGIDVAANLGVVIRSPVDGTAVLRNSGSAGRMVAVIKDGTALFFAHMDNRYVNTGDIIKKGDALGTIGMTGITSGPHVHIGYGLASPSPSGILFGRHRYKLTDPKLFFYKEQYLN